MGLSNGGGDSFADTTYINLKWTAETGPIEEADRRLKAPKLVVLGENFSETDEKYSRVSGKIIWLKPTSSKTTRGMVYGFRLGIEDPEDSKKVYAIESTVRLDNMRALNSIADAFYNSDDKYISLSLYVNKNGYPDAVVRNKEDKFYDGIFGFKDVTKEKIWQEISDRFESSNEQEVEEKPSEITVEDIPF